MAKTGGGGEKMIGYDTEQIKELQKNKFGFCLDFGHATKAAISLKVDYKNFIKDLLGLKPKVFHIYDADLIS